MGSRLSFLAVTSKHSMRNRQGKRMKRLTADFSIAHRGNQDTRGKIKEETTGTIFGYE